MSYIASFEKPKWIVLFRFISIFTKLSRLNKLNRHKFSFYAHWAQWWERSPPTNVSRVRILGPGVICGLSLLLVLFLAPRGFSPGTPVFSSMSSKTSISKCQFDLDYCQALYHEPLARVIARALPVFDIKFTFFTLCFWVYGIYVVN